MFNWYKPEPDEKPVAEKQLLPPAPPYMLQFFAYDHLPEPLQNISRPFCDLAHMLADTFPGNPEATEALRHLLEGKDCAVRAAVLQATAESKFDKAWAAFQEKEAAEKEKNENKTES